MRDEDGLNETPLADQPLTLMKLRTVSLNRPFHSDHLPP